MGSASRSKGRRAQTEGSQLLVDAGWTCVDTSDGTAVEDVFAIDRHGSQWSVEITADQTISAGAKWRQAVRQAAERGEHVLPLMLWKVDRAGWWLIVDGLAVEPMRAHALELELHPPGHVSFPTMARQLVALRPELHIGAMPVLRKTAHVIAPAELALVRWWA